MLTLKPLAITAAALGLVLAGPTIFAQGDAVDEFVTRHMQRQRIPGVSLAVVKDGHIVKAAGYGLASLQDKRPATADTVYRIGSITKQFVATGIMLLVEEGRLRLDDPIRIHLRSIPASWSAITVGHLLTHTSGLVREAPGYDRIKVQSDADVIQTAYALPLRFVPGSKWEYSNLGYMVLGEIIRTVAGRPWHEYLHDAVLKPSGLVATHILTTATPIANRAVGYTDNDKWVPVNDGVALHPAGGYLSTVLDLAKWDGVLRTDAVLGDSARRAMWTPVALSDGKLHPYGFGWELGEFRGRKRIRHGGETRGFRAEFTRFIDDGLTIIVLMNLDDADLDSLLAGIANLYLPRPSSSPR